MTDRAALIVTMQVPVPEQPEPDQPPKVEPVAAVAVSVTLAPAPKLAEQATPQLMPAGLDVMVPEPVPAGVTERVYVVKTKVAVTLCAAPFVRVGAHVPVPEQPPPLQPEKVEPTAAVAVRVAAGGLPGTLFVQVAVHENPVDDVTVPAPVPANVTVRVVGAAWAAGASPATSKTIRIKTMGNRACIDMSSMFPRSPDRIPHHPGHPP